jgi:hypothetical protein
MIAGTGFCCCCRTTPYVGPWTFWKGRITSAPILVHVRPAPPAREELRVNSALVIDSSLGSTCWGYSQERPIRATITRRPGFFLGRKDELLVAIGDDDFRTVSWHQGPVWNSGGGLSCGLAPEDEARLDAGERLAIRADITIFETSNPPGHMWMPERGDYRVLWHGCIEGGRPATRNR